MGFLSFWTKKGSSWLLVHFRATEVSSHAEHLVSVSLPVRLCVFPCASLHKVGLGCVTVVLSPWLTHSTKKRVQPCRWAQAFLLYPGCNTQMACHSSEISLKGSLQVIDCARNQKNNTVYSCSSPCWQVLSDEFVHLDLIRPSWNGLARYHYDPITMSTAETNTPGGLTLGLVIRCFPIEYRPLGSLWQINPDKFPWPYGEDIGSLHTEKIFTHH